jgi:Raf kinase inhibitor-like YbhB/YbcL family protein
MSKRLFFTAAALVVLATPAFAEMKLTSPDIAEGKPLGAAQVLNGFGCSGGNQAPALSWSGAPAATKSYVVMLRDPDAPTGSGFWHWVAFNIPATTMSLPAGGGAPTDMVTARNDFSQNAYAGACPPPGAPHRYVFTVFAMPDATLPLDATASAALVGFFAETGSLARATITATYGR